VFKTHTDSRQRSQRVTDPWALRESTTYSQLGIDTLRRRTESRLPTFTLATARSKSTEVSTIATFIVTVTSAMGVEGRAMQLLTMYAPFSCCLTACSIYLLVSSVLN
jgi:hypothetical protein